MISAVQIKAARLFLGWEQKQLAHASGLSLPTIQRIEKIGLERSSVANASKVIEALKAAGIEFIAEGAYNGQGGPGIRYAAGLDASRAEGDLPTTP